MTSLEEMLKGISEKHHKRINKYCNPLETHLGINHLCIYRETNDGQFSVLTSQPDWMRYYFANHLYLKQPHFCHPETFKECVALSKHIPDENYQELLQEASSKYNINFSLMLMNKTKLGKSIVFLDVNSKDKLHDTLLVNELPFIRRFIANFMEDHKDLFLLMNESQEHLSKLVKCKTKTASTPVMKSISSRHLLFNKFGLDLNYAFTLRETELLREYVKGYSATQIAQRLHLSKRTIEHSIERIKNKLCCQSKAELFQKAREFELFGII